MFDNFYGDVVSAKREELAQTDALSRSIDTTVGSNERDGSRRKMDKYSTKTI